jgi:tetratricopeptide (TPR) repeat protein
VDKGLELAEQARELLPNEPHTADTLGWIVYKKREYPRALGLLQESANKLPNEPAVQFHLGMAHYMMGEEEPARTALQQSLETKAAFSGSDEAAHRLSILSINAATVTDADRPALEKSLGAQTDDPIALARLAALYERDGTLDKAASAYQAALDINPANVGAMLNLVRLDDLRQETKKAMDLAKDVHKLAPNDPDVSHVLGRLAYKTGDFQWSYSLLQETVRAKPEDPGALFDLANAAFSVGNVPEAQEDMRHSIEAGGSGTQANDARRFLDMTALLDNPQQAAIEAPSIERVLKLDPGYAPALMAMAGAEDAKHESAAAMQNYEKVLGEYPDFPPAKRRLAILYSGDPSKDQVALDIAVKARETYPEDLQLEKALGIIVYRKGDFDRAASLLQDCSRQLTGDAELLYYLGMSRFQTKDLAASRRALQQALDLGLSGDRATEARNTLAAMK